MSMIPMAMYGLEVPCGDVAISARPDIPSAFRITMAAIDPSAEAEGETVGTPRATLKVIRQSLLDDEDDDEDDSDFDQDEMERILAGEASDEEDESESDEDEDPNGGPSDPAKGKKAKRAAVKEQIQQMLKEQNMDVDEDEDDDEKPNGVNGVAKVGKAKGKMPASDSDEDEDDDEDMDGMETEIEEFVICTLDPNKLYQQPLDITFGEDERVWFKVSGTHSIYLTGNYVEPIGTPGMYDPDSDDEAEYDMEPGEDELDYSEDESIDELDELENPRVTEVDEDEEAPALVKASKTKSKDKAATANKNKRPAPDSADEDEAEAGAEGLDEMIAKEAKLDQPTVNGEQKLSKKQLKKLKKADGTAGAAPAVKVDEKKEVEAPSSAKSDKKVSFAKDLEQGPTPTKDAKPAPTTTTSTDTTSKPTTKGTLGVKTVQGVTIDNKKLGKGASAKNGDRISTRYIGKLQDGKVFDSNKKGKPFSFKLGAGEVIKGWEIGMQGLQAGGERRITIPAHLAYGSKKLPDIPANSTLVFDVKLMEVHKGGK